MNHDDWRLAPDEEPDLGVDLHYSVMLRQACEAERDERRAAA